MVFKIFVAVNTERLRYACTYLNSLTRTTRISNVLRNNKNLHHSEHLSWCITQYLLDFSLFSSRKVSLILFANLFETTTEKTEDSLQLLYYTRQIFQELFTFRVQRDCNNILLQFHW